MTGGRQLSAWMRFLQRIYPLQGLEHLAQAIVTHLPELIDCDNVMVGRHDAGTRTLKALVLRQPFSQQQFLAEANSSGLLGAHPFWRRILDPHQPLKILSEMESVHGWRENPFYAEVLRQDRVQDHLNIEFGTSRRDFITVGIIRSRIGFSRAERDLMCFLRPHFELAFSNELRMNSVVECGRGAVHNGQCLVELDAWGGWRSRSDRARLFAFFGPADRSIETTVERWLNSCVDALNRGASESHCRRKLKSPLGRIIHLSLLRDWHKPGYLLAYGLSDSMLLQAVDLLSARERAILHLVADGLSNPQISLRMGIGVETVKTHLKHIFRKLGVETRTAAVAVLKQIAVTRSTEPDFSRP